MDVGAARRKLSPAIPIDSFGPAHAAKVLSEANPGEPHINVQHHSTKATRLRRDKVVLARLVACKQERADEGQLANAAQLPEGN